MSNVQMHPANKSMYLQRLRKELAALQKDPIPNMYAEPLPSNMLEWHFVFIGPDDTPFQGGQYHGKIKFPPEYPYKPPGIMMITPNGRFATNTRICMSMSDFHPESWNCMWSVSSILTGLVSFMVETSKTVGCIETTVAQKRAYARDSYRANAKDAVFCEIFPQLVRKDEAPSVAADVSDESVNSAELRKDDQTMRDVMRGLFVFLAILFAVLAWLQSGK